MRSSLSFAPPRAFFATDLSSPTGLARVESWSGEAPAIPPLGGDDVPDDTTSTVGVNVLSGQTLDGSVEHAGDKDFYAFTGSAGTTYEFTLTPVNTGSTGPDLLIQIVNSAGVVVAELDGGGMGGTEELDFTPAADGAYWVNVQGYLPVDIGGYSLTGKLDDDAPNPNDGTPLAALDWGGTANRVNTDGVTDADGREVIHVYFAKLGDITPHPITGTNVNTGWQDFEKAAAFVSFKQYENIINVKFVEVDAQADADFIFGISPSAPVLLGAMSPPGEADEGAAWFNSAGSGWDEAGLQQGGFGFITFTHELGHGMGMAHPHDNGGGSEIMHGVESDTDSGDFGMNQGIHTVMTYNDGWPDGPDGKSPDNGYGFQGTLMALDIALLQQKYAATTDYRSGADTYLLPELNQSGTFYACLWDTGGVDTIVSDSGQDATIDLRPATLQYEFGGGGWVSYNAGTYGGFTIANGVVIENATSGAGKDRLTGNDADNVLTAGAGNDVLVGGRGGDTLVGGDGSDIYYIDSTRDVVVETAAGGRDKVFSSITFNLVGTNVENAALTGALDRNLIGSSDVNVLVGNAGDNILAGKGGMDNLTGGGGADVFDYNAVSESTASAYDRIVDLADDDVIDLSGIDANSTLSGNQAFTLVGAFTGAAGQLALTLTAGGNTLVNGDVNGDGKADFRILLTGDHQDYANFAL